MYNSLDKKNYGTSVERLADTYYVTQAGAKWYDTDEGVEYISDGTYWRIKGEDSGSPEIR